MVIQTVAKGDPRAPYSVKHPMYLKWDKFINKYNANAPSPMNTASQTAKIWWSWLPSERAFITSAFSGMAIASCICFVILIIATRNIF